jgi:biopolymer transport protein ExbD
MGAGSNSDDELTGSINVTPLVDVMLVLLVIFMITAKLDAASVVPHDLPSAAAAETTESVFTVEIDAGGKLRVRGEVLGDVAALERLARVAVLAQPELRVIIHADRRIDHGTVIEVMDALRLAGATRVGFAVEPDLSRGGPDRVE